MDKLHALGLLTTVALGLACSERIASTNGVPVEPLCLRLIGTMGHGADGTQRLVQWPGGAPYVCICVTEEQFWDPAEIDRLAEELNDLLLDECQRAADLQDFAWDECEADHDAGEWTDTYYRGTFLGTDTSYSCGGEGWLPEENPEPPWCELGSPGCSCTVDATCTGGTTCIDGMCTTP